MLAFLEEAGQLLATEGAGMLFESGTWLVRDQQLLDSAQLSDRRPRQLLKTNRQLCLSLPILDLVAADRIWVVGDVGWYRAQRILSAGPGSTTIEGAAAAGRALGKSEKTIRRWLARCPPSSWPKGSRPGARPPVWLDRPELDGWWALRQTWRQVPQPQGRKARTPRKSGTPAGGAGDFLARLRSGD